MGYQGGGNRGGGFRRNNSFGGPREMHKIKCAECGEEGEVPFKPRGDSPVYCKDCFMKKKGITPTDKPQENKEEAKDDAAEEAEESKDESEAEEEKVEDSEEESETKEAA